MTVHARMVPVLDERKVISELQSLRSRQPVEYFAFYSSQLKGVVTDPALMVVPFDDHIVHRGHAGLSYPERWYTEGLRVMTTTYPIKAPLYAITKATNYLPNVLMQMEAKEKGFDNGVFIDEDGNVGESSNMNVAFVSRHGVLVHPKFDHILSGCTSLRLLELARAHQDRARVTGVEVRNISVAEARASREMLQLGSSIKVAPVVQWDDQVIGDGKPGPVSKALLQLLEEDMRSSDRLIPVPY